MEEEESFCNHDSIDFDADEWCPYCGAGRC